VFFLKKEKEKNLKTIASLQNEISSLTEKIKDLEAKVSEAQDLIDDTRIKCHDAFKASDIKVSNYTEITSSQIDTIRKKQRVIYTWIFLLCIVSIFSTAVYMKFF
jgi:FtsZ-binding cell division protein ZapB